MTAVGRHRRNAGARVAIGVPAMHRSRRVGRVKSFDHSLWERELAEYMSLHPDLENLPPPVVPTRWSRFYHRLRRLRLFRALRRIRQFRLRRPRAGSGFLYLIIIVLVQSVVLSAILGWWMGWHL